MDQTKLLELFEQATALPAPQRAAFLNRACAGEAPLRKELESLLAAQEDAGEFLQATVTAPPPSEGSRPSRIGPYHILELLGVGGMGEVYKAEQRVPIKRIVAIKIIKLGFNSREVIARFESERQALARMDHPNVAKVLDAGISEQGQPYFVMEYVPGRPITNFCDDNKLSIKDRLLLFTQACEAISHAHTKALIHRDIKAANVLAYMQDGKPTVKVIDFGIAKALTGDRLTDATFNTQQGHVVGTYDSMSPEQADGSPDIDTRTDVYSLGVLLYELLSGAKPFDHETLAKAADQEIRRIIREVDPPRPSTRLSRLHDSATRCAQLRQMDLDALARQLRSELEWIPLMAMRKERSRRYASPLELARDIDNYLNDRPLHAGPESQVYRLRKFASRNRRAVIVSAVVAALAIAGAAAYVRGIRREEAKTRAEQVKTKDALELANRRQQTTDAINTFLTDVLYQADPGTNPGHGVTVKEAVNRAAAAVGGRFRDAPEVEASVRSTLGAVYLKLGEPDEARKHLDRAHGLAVSIPNISESDLATIVSNLCRVLPAQDALALQLDARNRLRKSRGLDDPDTLTAEGNYAAMLHDLGRNAEAEPILRGVLARRRRVLGNEHPNTLESMNDVAGLAPQPEAIALLRDAVTAARRVLPRDHPDTLSYMRHLAVKLDSADAADEVQSLLREVIDAQRRVLGDEHPDTITTMSQLGEWLWSNGNPRAAEPLLRNVLEWRQRRLGENHPATVWAIYAVADSLARDNRTAEATSMFQREFEVSKTIVGDASFAAGASSHYGVFLVKTKRYAEAEEPLLESLRRLEAAGRGKSDRAREVLQALVSVYTETQRPEQSARYQSQLTTITPATQR